MRSGGLSRVQALDAAYRGPRLMAILGDSIGAQGFGGSVSLGYTYATVGYATWAAFLSRRRVDLLPASNQAVAGQTTAQILARVPAVIALNPGVCCVLAGTNDIGTLTPAQTIANLRTMYDALQAAGILVCAIPILPRGGITTAQQGHLQQVNAWIRAQQGTRRNWVLADCELAYIDLATGAPRAAMSADALHPNSNGAFAIGNVVANTLAAYFPDPMLPFMNRLDVYSANDNPRGNLLAAATALTEGTTGVFSNGPTGELATGWTANGLNMPAGTTVVGAKIAKADGRSFQQLTFAGTYTNANPGNLNVTTASVHGSGTTGDMLEAVAEIEWDAGITNLAGFQLLLNVASPGGNPIPTDLAANNTYIMPTVAGAGIAKTPRVTLPAVPTQVTAILRAVARGSAGALNLAGVVRFGSVSIRKVA